MVNKGCRAIIMIMALLSACDHPAESKKTVLLVMWGAAVEGLPSHATLVNLQNETNTIPQIINFYLQWPLDSAEIGVSPFPSLNAIWSYGALPCLTWEPFGEKNQEKYTIAYEEILNGKYDNYISNMAKTIQSFGKPLLLRFAHEMNLDVYHWGSERADYGAKSPEIYQKMFRYTVDLFRKHNVSNVLWVFCPNVDSVPNEPWNAFKNYYPGANYVDILGIDGYSWTERPERSFAEIFDLSFKELKALDYKKPLFIFETAASGSDSEKNQWLQQAFQTAKSWGIQGIVWFQANKEKNWKIRFSNDPSEIREITSFSQSWGYNQLD